MRRAGVVLAALLVVLAGCTGGPAGGETTAPSTVGTDTPGDAETNGETSGGDADVSGPAGSVNFYVSDRPGAIEDFASLNVTIDEVRFHLVDAAESNETATETANETTVTTTLTGNATTTAGNATATATPAETAEASDETEADEADEADDRADGGDGRWVVREVDGTTVDLTRLRGNNATLVEEFDLPAGEYNKVFLLVSDVNATLTDGSDQRVKLPSGKLQLNTEFEVTAGGEVNFVYDVMVHKAGKSGKYILRPVLSESGTDQPIDPVDRRGRPADDERDKGDEGDEERADDERANETKRTGLSVTLQGRVAAGENVTVLVTNGSGTVENAAVTVNGETVGTTNADGRLAVTVPADADELEIEVRAGDAVVELERTLDRGGKGGNENGGEGDGTN